MTGRKSTKFALSLRAWLFAFVVALLARPVADAQLVEVGDGGPGPVKAQHLTAELTLLRPELAAGGKAEAGLVLTMEEGWRFGSATRDQVEPAQGYYGRSIAVSCPQQAPARPPDGLRL